jgi:competence protein ComEC
MSAAYHIYIWKKAPFLRLLIPFVAGILLQYYFTFSISLIVFVLVFLLLLFTIFNFLSDAKRFKFRVLQGLIVSFFIMLCGQLITWQKDARNQQNWYGNSINDSSTFVARILEPATEKAKTFKALAAVENVVHKGFGEKTSGRILLYFSKDSNSQKLNYGDKILIKSKVQSILNSGNPGAFDYERYCSFQQIFHQVFIRQNQWLLLKETNANVFQKTIFSTRGYILKCLQKFIPGEKQSSLAKALLIGYRIDLDKNLVQAYSNIGVVHLIAISGMHLALIYFFLVWIFSKIPFINKSPLTKLILILGGLWFFSLLTGAPASVLRAAVMFSFIAIGSYFNKQNSIYNSLAASAFLLLCFDPYMLWDVGFQLSYLAVLGIVMCQKSIYHWVYFKNKIFNAGWQLMSVSLAAQIFTLPLCIYYFHQFPLLFLISNMVAIPLSTAALWGSLIIIAASPVPALALFFGKLVMLNILLLNQCVLLINSIPFGLWEGLSVSPLETIFLYFIVAFLLYWLLEKSKLGLKMALCFSVIFIAGQFYKTYQSVHQKKIIVYNVNQHPAIDFIDGSKYYFLSDSLLKNDPLLINYNLKPARTAFFANKSDQQMPSVFHQKNFYQFYQVKLLVIDSALQLLPVSEKLHLDYVIISKNAPVEIESLVMNFDCNYFIFDGSNSSWKIEQWKKECEELHLRSHSVSEKGAFVTDL